MHPYHHACSSAKKYGGDPSNYLAIHQWFDATKILFGDARHRALRHHTAGIFWCEEQFGATITNSDLKEIPVRIIGEQHVIEDMGFLPTAEWWLNQMPLTPKMNRVPTKPQPDYIEELRQAAVIEMYKTEG